LPSANRDKAIENRNSRSLRVGKSTPAKNGVRICGGQQKTLPD
jgi:hypothetical protein